MCRHFLSWLIQQLQQPARPRRTRSCAGAAPLQRVFAPPKPKWVRHEVIRLKAVMPEAGCRTLAHHFNRRWKPTRQMTVSKTDVADLCRRHQYLISEVRRKLKHICTGSTSVRGQVEVALE